MIISIVNHKGGTGKTATTINLGYTLASSGFKALLIDLDLQANLSYSLGLVHQKPSISNVLLRVCAFSDTTYATENLFAFAADGLELKSQIELITQTKFPAYENILL